MARVHHRLEDPGKLGEEWGLEVSALISSEPATKRLALFVHGFGGSAVSTWQQFPKAIIGSLDDFWSITDCLFIGYDSTGLSISAATDSIGNYLRNLVPLPPASFASVSIGERTYSVRSNPTYSELVLIGHSLGGVVVRNVVRIALRDIVLFDSPEVNGAVDISGLGETERVIARATVKLFAPALGGARMAGLLGLASTFGLPRIRYARSASFKELTDSIRVLEDIRADTEELYEKTSAPAFSADILWARNDDVITPTFYRSDRNGRYVDGVTHRTICKPNAVYDDPVAFVRSARLEEANR